MNEAVLVPVPPGVVTAIGPPVAPVGTVQVIWLYEVTVKTAGVPLKVTAVAPVKALPVIVTVVPVLPELGLKAETVGITPNVAGLDPLPAGVATLMVPVSAPEGTVAVMVESETTVNAAAVLRRFRDSGSTVEGQAAEGSVRWRQLLELHEAAAEALNVLAGWIPDSPAPGETVTPGEDRPLREEDKPFWEPCLRRLHQATDPAQEESEERSRSGAL